MIINNQIRKITYAVFFIVIITISSIVPIYYLNNNVAEKTNPENFDENFYDDIISEDTINILKSDALNVKNSITPIGTNVLILANENDVDLIEQIFVNSIISPKIYFNKNNFINALNTQDVDIVIVLSIEEKFSNNEIELIEDLISSGRNFIATSNVLNFNPEFKNLLNIEDFIQLPNLLTNSSIISDYYLVKKYLNQVISTKESGTLYFPDSTSLILAEYDRWTPPFIQLINKSSNSSKTSSGNEVKIELTLKNSGWSFAEKVIIKEFLNGFELKRCNLECTIEDGYAIVEIVDFMVNEEITVEFTVQAPSVTTIKTFPLITEIIYFDHYGNCYEYPDVNLYNYFDFEIVSPIIEIEVSVMRILAWCDDPSDKFFISEVLDGSWSYVEVNSIKDLMGNLTQLDYDILWLMDFGWADFSCNYTLEEFLKWSCNLLKVYRDFGESEAKIIKEWVGKGGKIISSDWALQVHQKSLNQLYGIKNLGCIPPIFLDIDEEYLWDGFIHDHQWTCEEAGQTWCYEKRFEWDWYHLISLSKDHCINDGYNGSCLKSKAWAFDINLYSESEQKANPGIGLSETIAYFCRPSWFSDKIIYDYSPAIIASTYKEGKGVYFSPDIGRSAFRGYNTSAWVEIAKNALIWLSFGQNEPIEPEPVEFIIQEIDIPKDWVQRYIDLNLPSISISSFGEGRSLFFAFDTEVLLNEIFFDVIYDACFRMTYLEDIEGFTLDINGLQSKQYEFVGKGYLMLNVETENRDELEIITLLDGVEIEPFILPIDSPSTPILLEQEGNHILEFRLNSTNIDSNDVFIKTLSLQTPLLYYNDDYFEDVSSIKYYFKAGGFVSIASNISGTDMNIYIDNQYIHESNNSDYILFQNEVDLSYGFHVIEINSSESFNLTSLAVLFDIDQDGDGIGNFREFLCNTDFKMQDPWMLWKSLGPEFELNNSIRDYYFNFTGFTNLYIPSNYSNQPLFLDINTIKGTITNFKLNDILIAQTLNSPIELLLTEEIPEGFSNISFNYKETNQGCYFNMQFQVGNRLLYNLYEIDYTDSDGDGICDSEEFLNGLHPLNPDVDGDLAFDGIDYCPSYSEILPGNSPITKEIGVVNRNWTIRLTIQIETPEPNYKEDFEALAATYPDQVLPWNEGHIDIIPMLRIFGSNEYIEDESSFYGDYLPNQTFNNGYIAISPLLSINQESWMSVVFYEPNHPSFDNNLTFTFDMVWVVIQTLDNGSIIPLHLWVHPNDIVIQGFTKTEIAPVNIGYAIMGDLSIAGRYYDLIRYQLAPYNNYSLILSEDIEEILEETGVKSVNYLDSSEYINELIATWANLYVTDINSPKQLLQSIIVETLSEKIIQPFHQSVKAQVKADTLLNLMKDIHGNVSADVIKRGDSVFYDVDFINYNSSRGNTYVSQRVEAFAVINKLSFNLTYKSEMKYGSDPIENDSIHISVKDFRSRVTDIIYRKITYERIEKHGEKLKSLTKKLLKPYLEKVNYVINEKLKYIWSTVKKWVSSKSITPGRLKSLFSSSKQYVRKLATKIKTSLLKRPKLAKLISKESKLYEGAVKFVSCLSKNLKSFIKVAKAAYLSFLVVLDIIDTIEFIVMAIKSPDGTPIGIRILMGIYIVVSIASILLSVVTIAVILGILGEIASVSALTVYGLILTAILLVVMLLLWIFRPKQANFQIITDWGEQYNPKCYFDEKTNKIINYKFSPEVGAVLITELHVLNTGEAILDWIFGRMTIGNIPTNDLFHENWGNWSILLRYPNLDFGPIYTWGLGKIRMVSVCKSWGVHLDGLIQLNYEFRDDWVNPPVYIFIPLDLNVNFFPTTIEQFLDEFSIEKITVKEAYAIHVATDGALEYKYVNPILGVINEDYIGVYGSSSVNGNLTWLGNIDGDSDANDAWVIGFTEKTNLLFTSFFYHNTPGTTPGESFELQHLQVSYGKESYECHDVEKNGICRIGSSLFLTQGYIYVVFSSNEQWTGWLEPFSIKWP